MTIETVVTKGKGIKATAIEDTRNRYSKYSVSKAINRDITEWLQFTIAVIATAAETYCRDSCKERKEISFWMSVHDGYTGDGLTFSERLHCVEAELLVSVV
jgi:hypothetical protein